MVMKTVREVKMGEISARVLHHSKAVVLAASSLRCVSLHGSINPQNLKENQVREIS
jgi:hypothetical protein